MMSTLDKVVPFSPAPPARPSSGATGLALVPGISPEAIQGLETSYPGTLTGEMRSLLEATCGLTAAEFGTVDLTSRWHPEESLNVFRPCLTLAIDDEGNRWIAETSCPRGLPGPVWCVLPQPAVAIYASDDLADFLDTLVDKARRGRLPNWLRNMHRQACMVWEHRQALAWESYRACQHDRGVRGWLAELPFGAQVYDLREPSDVRGWPYGLAGPEGRLYRCGRLPVFAVSASPSASRWRQHMTDVAAKGEIPRTAVAGSMAA